MKNYEILASKEIVASFEMNYSLFKTRFCCSRNLAEWIKGKHPEYKEAPYEADFKGEKVIINFLSLGNLVIQEQ